MEETLDRFVVAREIIASPDAAALTDHAVAIREGRIAAIVPAERIPAAVEVVDLGDAVIFPGLIDVHVHLGFDGSHEPERPMTRGDETALRAHVERQGLAFLRAGVTTVRDLGCTGTTITELAADPRAAGLLPRLSCANEPLGISGGHCDYMSTSCDSQPELLAAIERRAAEGADVVKIMLTGGFIDDGGEAAHRVVYSEETLSAAVRHAHALGLRVAVHAHNVAGITQSARAGVDTVEHCSMIERSGIAGDPAPYRELAASGIIAVPTVSALWNVDLPWAPRDEALDAIRGLIAHGVPIAYGSDTGIPGALPGRPLEGLEILVRAGMSATDALRAATTRAAEALGKRDVGSLAHGSRADLLVLGEDPRRSLDALADPRGVFSSGEALDTVTGTGGR